MELRSVQICLDKGGETMKGTKESFLAEYFKRFPDSELSFENAEYGGSKTKMIVKDPLYGDFMVSPSNLLRGAKHPRRKGESIAGKKKMSWSEVVDKMKEAHAGENLEYPQQEYVNMHTKIRIIDHDLRRDGNEYGEYWQTPANHIKGCGHPEKGAVKQGLEKRLNTAEFLERARKIHSDRYQYNGEYVSYRTPMEMVCPIHGEFMQTPETHLQNKGCPKCACTYSKSADEIFEMVRAWLPDENVIKNDRTVLEGKEIDIYIPGKGVGIEYDGLQWHTKRFGKDRNYHIGKTRKCAEKGVMLYHIFEDEYKWHKDLVVDKLKTVLGVNGDKEKVSARKSAVREISDDRAKDFLGINHMQGYVVASLHMGAFVGERLYAVMSFKRTGAEGVWELSRFATDINFVCRGFAGKLFSAFLRIYEPEEVKSFADIRWTPNPGANLYTKLGFELAETEAPNYSYYNHNCGVRRFHKFGFRKRILKKKYGLDGSLTEREMTEELGFDRVYDCGLYKFVWKRKIQ